MTKTILTLKKHSTFATVKFNIFVRTLEGQKSEYSNFEEPF